DVPQAQTPKAQAPIDNVPPAPIAVDPFKHRFPLEAAMRPPSAQEIKSGREVYLGHCSECHVFHDPAVYKAEEWSSLINKMEGKAKLSRDERERLERFVATIRPPNP